MRVYGGENDSKGANAGIFFRRLDGETLYGINSFADYEDGDYGEFLRYGIGGELQNRHLAFAMNYYFPITDDKHNGATVAFSQEGYDANLRINIPQLDFLKVAADYYYFDGKYGGEDDKGFRYGLEVQPINDLRIGVFYDDGGEKFGGDIVYVYNFGIPQKRESAVAFSPDLFAPVLREYSQRISIAETTPFAFITTAMTTTRRITTSAMTTTIFSTMAGLRTTTYMTAAGMTATRMASVHFTARFDGSGADGPFSYVATTQVKYLITLPSVSELITPLFITIERNFGKGGNEFWIIESNHRLFGEGPISYQSGLLSNLTATITEGSEDFVSVAIERQGTYGGRCYPNYWNDAADDNGNDKGGNDGGKWELTFAAPVVAVIVILVVVKVVIIISVVIAVIIIIPDSVITSAAVILVVPVVSVIATLTKSSLPSVIVAVRFDNKPD